MKSLKFTTIPSLVFATILSLSDSALAESSVQKYVLNGKNLVVFTASGRPVSLDANKIKEEILPQNGEPTPDTTLEIYVHDETEEVWITNRGSINVFTDLIELGNCCPNLATPPVRSVDVWGN